MALARQVDEEEQTEGRLSLPLGKAPYYRIDGFGASFFRSYWPIIKVEVMQAVSLFFGLHAPKLEENGDCPHSQKGFYSKALSLYQTTGR